MTGEKSCGQWGLGLSELTARGHLALLAAMHGQHPLAGQLADQARATADQHGWSPEPQASAHMIALAMVALDTGRLDDADRLITLGTRGTNPHLASRAAFAALAVEVALARNDQQQAARRAAALTDLAPRPELLPPMLAGWTDRRAGRQPAGPGPGRYRPRAAESGTEHRFRQCPAGGQSGQMLAGPGRPKGSVADTDLVVAGLRRLSDRRGGCTDRCIHWRRSGCGWTRRRWNCSPTPLISQQNPASSGRSGPPESSCIRCLTGIEPWCHGIPSSLTPCGRHCHLAKSPAPSSAVASHRILTDRERAVLPYLATHLKAGEIASDLYLSVNTVKSHQQAIYRKLGVSSRRDAVDRGRELGLI